MSNSFFAKFKIIFYQPNNCSRFTFSFSTRSMISSFLDFSFSMTSFGAFLRKSPLASFLDTFSRWPFKLVSSFSSRFFSDSTFIKTYKGTNISAPDITAEADKPGFLIFLPIIRLSILAREAK
jgi:hypothetical protein